MTPLRFALAGQSPSWADEEGDGEGSGDQARKNSSRVNWIF